MTSAPVMISPFAFMEYSAEISPCGQYRWWLKRRWSNGTRDICFIMLNPSTADAEKDDPTIRRCIGFAKHWEFDSLTILNLFALRSTDKRALLNHRDPVGRPRADDDIRMAEDSAAVVAAWGDFVPYFRDLEVLRLLGKMPILCLGTTKNKRPKHPLYLSNKTKPEFFEGNSQ